MNFPEHTIRGPRSFVSQSTIDEQRKKRQEEWEKTRKPDDPLEAPEEVYDPRTLYERLQEQKMKKEAEFEEKSKLQNLIPLIDSDEAQYLEAVEKKREELELIKLAEEEKAVAEYKLALSHMTNDEQEKRLAEFRSLINGGKKVDESDKKSSSSSSLPSVPAKRTQAALLSGIVRRNNSSPHEDSKKGEKRKLESDSESDPSSTDAKKQDTTPQVKSTVRSSIECLGILPGIGIYGSDSSDSEASSLSDQDDLQNSDFSLVPKVTISGSSHKQEEVKK